MTVPADWLDDLRRALGTIAPEQLSPRFPHPPADARPSAVLMLFGDGPDGPDGPDGSDGTGGPELVFTERAATLRQHARQISFPGGRTDDTDRDAVHTALREAQEEIGLDPGDVHVLGTLPRIWLPPSNHAVTTVIGHRAPGGAPLVPVSLAEVATVLHTPVQTLIDPDRRYTVVHPSGWRGPAFDIGADVPLWGFTAGIVDRVLDQLGWAPSWDHGRNLPLPQVFLQEHR